MFFLSDMFDQFCWQQDEEQVLVWENFVEVSLFQVYLSYCSVLYSCFCFDLVVVMDCLCVEVFGQELVLQVVEDMFKVVCVDIVDLCCLLFSVLFFGFIGVGKIEIVCVLVRVLYGDVEGFCWVDMNILFQEYYVVVFIGVLLGYVGVKEGIILLEQDKLDGSFGCFGIVFFDELEKVSLEVVYVLFNVFDNGLLWVVFGECIYYFCNILVFMISNFCVYEIQCYDECC